MRKRDTHTHALHRKIVTCTWVPAASSLALLLLILLVVGIAKHHPRLSSLQVPKVVRHIFEYCDEKITTAAHSFPTLLDLMASKWPRRVVATALKVAPIFRYRP